MGILDSIKNLLVHERQQKQFYIDAYTAYIKKRENYARKSKPKVPLNKNYYKLSIWGRMNSLSANVKIEAAKNMIRALKNEPDVVFTDIELLALTSNTLGDITKLCSRDGWLPTIYVQTVEERKKYKEGLSARKSIANSASV